MEESEMKRKKAPRKRAEKERARFGRVTQKNPHPTTTHIHPKGSTQK